VTGSFDEPPFDSSRAADVESFRHAVDESLCEGALSCFVSVAQVAATTSAIRRRVQTSVPNGTTSPSVGLTVDRARDASVPAPEATDAWLSAQTQAKLGMASPELEGSLVALSTSMVALSATVTIASAEVPANMSSLLSLLQRSPPLAGELAEAFPLLIAASITTTDPMVTLVASPPAMPTPTPSPDATAASPPTSPLPPTPGSPGGLLDEGGGDNLREEQGGGAKIGGGSIAAIVVCVVLAVCLLGAVSYKMTLKMRSERVEVRKPPRVRRKWRLSGSPLQPSTSLVDSPKSGVPVEPDPATRKPTAEQYQIMQALELTPALPSPPPIRLSAVPADHLSPKTTDSDIVSISLDEVHVKASGRASAAGVTAASRLSIRALPGSPLRGMHKTAVVEVDGKALANSSAASLPVATDGGPGEESQVPINISPAGLRGFANLSPDDPLSVYDPV